MKLTEKDERIINRIVNEHIRLSDYGLDRFLEPEEIKKLTVAEYQAYEAKLKAYRDARSVLKTAAIKSYIEGLQEALEEKARS